MKGNAVTMRMRHDEGFRPLKLGESAQPSQPRQSSKCARMVDRRQSECPSRRDSTNPQAALASGSVGRTAFGPFKICLKSSTGRCSSFIIAMIDDSAVFESVRMSEASVSADKAKARRRRALGKGNKIRPLTGSCAHGSSSSRRISIVDIPTVSVLWESVPATS